MKKHRNILYSLIIIMLVIQIASFTILGLQASNTRTEIDDTNKNLTKYITHLLKERDAENQQKFSEISDVLADQKKDINQEISLLKSAQADFSGVIEESVKGVVSIGTDMSGGTGFIVDSEGYVVTNQHVIDDAVQIRVLTYDRRVYSAELIGQDLLRDLALLKLEGKFDSLELGDSDEVQVGKKVIAIGNPLGLSFSVSEGIVSALNRIGPNGFREYIQTDVSLNPGNSGGPLIDSSGKVIGINNFKLGDSEGLGFALESNAIRVSINILANKTLIT